MNIKQLYIILILSTLQAHCIFAQSNCENPLPPILTSVSVEYGSEAIELKWTLSPSSNVAGYIVYSYEIRQGNAEFYAIDTLKNPLATSYTFYTARIYKSFQFRIAALRLPDCKSELSNILSTIFTHSEIDTCNNRINIQWNKYSSTPVKVTGYDVHVSVNGATYYLAGHVSDDVSTFALESITNEASYCFIVKAILENGLVSGSNKSCVDVKPQKIPAWINADFATVTESDEISLSFSIDPSSETDLYSLERKTGYSGSFQQIEQIRSALKILTYTDKTVGPEIVYFYRISAINSCYIPVASSNIASNIVISAQNTGSDIILKWNQYRGWLGTISDYRLFTDTGNGYTQTAALGPADTTFSISIPEIMYGLKEGQACFYVTAAESGNPYGINGVSNSNKVCVEIEEVITVPNVFTPDGDLKNDLFRPVITFTPAEYRLLISNRQGKRLFEADDFMESWDGTDMGNPVQEGVYLWFLRLKTPEGKSISRTGTVTIIKSR